MEARTSQVVINYLSIVAYCDKLKIWFAKLAIGQHSESDDIEYRNCWCKDKLENIESKLDI